MYFGWPWVIKWSVESYNVAKKVRHIKCWKFFIGKAENKHWKLSLLEKSQINMNMNVDSHDTDMDTARYMGMNTDKDMDMKVDMDISLCHVSI